MPTELFFGFSWCLGMSFVALGYGEYTSLRQSQGRPITLRERGRNLLVVYAIGVAAMSFVFLLWTRLPLPFVFQQLRWIAGFALAPLVLWYCFELPLRLVRRFASRKKTTPASPHPLDGFRSDRSSSLDQLLLRQPRSANPDPVPTADQKSATTSPSS